MSIRNATFTLSILALSSVGLAGCNSDPTAGIELVPVSGTVTFNNKPLEGALVTFTPDVSNADSTPGNDTSGPEGNYKAMYRGRSGLAPGKYKVTVTKTILPPGAASDAEEDPYMNQVAAESTARGGGRAAARPTEVKGEFDREVEPAGATLDFDVKGKESALSAAK